MTRNALAPYLTDMGGYDQEQVPLSYQRQGGVLDALGIIPPSASTPDYNGVLDYAGQGAALLDHYAMGIPRTMAGLVNAAIPGQPLGDLNSINDSAETARMHLARSRLGRDLLALPEAFAGSVPGGAGHATARETKVTVRPSETYPRPYEVNPVPPAPDGYMRAYHGSPNDFDEFRGPVFFSPSRTEAEKYATGGGGNGNFNGLGTASSPTKSGYMYEVDLPNPSSEYIVPDLQSQGNPFIAAVQQAEKNGDAVASFRYGRTGQELAALDTSGIKIRNKYDYDPQEQFSYPGAVLTQTGPSNASAYLDLFGAGARQAGRAAESLIDPVYNAMPDNAVGSAGGKLSGPQLSTGNALSPPGIKAYHGSPHDPAVDEYLLEMLKRGR